MNNFEIKIFNSFSEELKGCVQFEDKSFQHIFQSYEWQNYGTKNKKNTDKK